MLKSSCLAWFGLDWFGLAGFDSILKSKPNFNMVLVWYSVMSSFLVRFFDFSIFANTDFSWNCRKWQSRFSESKDLYIIPTFSKLFLLFRGKKIGRKNFGAVHFNHFLYFGKFFAFESFLRLKDFFSIKNCFFIKKIVCAFEWYFCSPKKFPIFLQFKEMFNLNIPSFNELQKDS